MRSNDGVNGSYTSHGTYGNSIKSGDSYLTLTDSQVDCFYVGTGGSSNNSSNNYTHTTKNIVQVCNADGTATVRFQITQKDTTINSFNGFIDVQYSTNNSSWQDLASGTAFNDGETLTFDSPSALNTGTTAYFRFRIAETDPTDSDAWGVYTLEVNCQADFTISQSITTCTAAGQVSTLTVVNNENQTIYLEQLLQSQVPPTHLRVAIVIIIQVIQQHFLLQQIQHTYIQQHRHIQHLQMDIFFGECKVHLLKTQIGQIQPCTVMNM